MKQIGISPKGLAPALLQVVALLVNWIATGEFDRVELAQVIGVALTAIVGYLASPGTVERPAENGNPVLPQA
jgi:hypothetical protein